MNQDNPENLQKEIDETLAIMEILYRRLNETNLLKTEEREHLAYQAGEIILSCKKLYLELIPFLTTPESQKAEPLFDFLVELRMNFLNLKDLIEDFEDSFLNSLTEPQEEEDDACPEADPEPDPEHLNLN